MKSLNLMTGLLLCGLMSAQTRASAVTSDNPYVQVITNRNPFALKPPPDPISLVPQAPPPALPSVKLVGITTIMGGKRALLRVARPARPPAPAAEIPLTLREGGPTEEGVRIVEINVAAATVKIQNQGTEQMLSMEKDAPPASAGPAPGVPVPGIPVPPPNPASGIPVPVPAAAPSGGGITAIPRTLRTKAETSAASSSAGIVGAGPSGIAKSELPPVPSAEEQVILMEAWRIRDADKIASGDLPPYPPTELQEIMEQEAAGELALPGF